MTTIIDWFKTIAFALNDDEPGHTFTRYGLDKMVAAYNDAMALIYKYRPDLFTEWELLKLTTGQYQDMRNCCDQILSVTDQVTVTGATIKPIIGDTNTKTTVKRNWNKPSCISYADAPSGYVINNVSVEPSMNGRFTVDPPVPVGVDAYVRVKCVKSPCPITVAGVNAEFNTASDMVAASWHFVLARMLTGDRFAQTANRDMDFHYKMFFQILGVVLKQEEWIESVEEAKR